MSDAKRLRPDILHAHWLLPNGFMAAVVARRLKIPLAISVPGSDAQVANANPLFRAMARFALRQADLLTANSEELRDAVLAIARQGDKETTEQGKRKIEKKFEIIYGTDPNRSNRSNRRNRITQSPCHRVTQSPYCPALSAPLRRSHCHKRASTSVSGNGRAELRQRNVLAVMGAMAIVKDEWQALAANWALASVFVGQATPKTEIHLLQRLRYPCPTSVSKPADGLNVCVLDAMSCATSGRLERGR
jgi:hypothetical protein